MVDFVVKICLKSDMLWLFLLSQDFLSFPPIDPVLVPTLQSIFLLHTFAL